VPSSLIATWTTIHMNFYLSSTTFCTSIKYIYSFHLPPCLPCIICRILSACLRAAARKKAVKASHGICQFTDGNIYHPNNAVARRIPGDMRSNTATSEPLCCARVV
jgi:hypothetical protein